LAEELAASVGVASDFSKSQAINALALVRQIAATSTQLADFTRTKEVAAMILAYAAVHVFNADNRYEHWQKVRDCARGAGAVRAREAARPSAPLWTRRRVEPGAAGGAGSERPRRP